jgi:hypothetical protein
VRGQGWEAWYSINTGIPENSIGVDFQIIPNPVASDVVISFHLPEGDIVGIWVYDIVGQKVDYLQNEYMPAGNHSVSYNVSQLPDGIYFCRLRVGQGFVTHKMLKQ